MKQNLRSMFDGREWRPNGVTDFASHLVCLCCGCECLLGKTLQDRVLSITEFPERHRSARRFPSFRQTAANGVTTESQSRVDCYTMRCNPGKKRPPHKAALIPCPPCLASLRSKREYSEEAMTTVVRSDLLGPSRQLGDRARESAASAFYIGLVEACGLGEALANPAPRATAR